MYEIYARFIIRYLSFLLTFSLARITDVKIDRTNNFFNSYFLVGLGNMIRLTIQKKKLYYNKKEFI